MQSGTRSCFASLMLAALLLATALAAQAAPVLTRIEAGQVQGSSADGVQIFRGIP